MHLRGLCGVALCAGARSEGDSWSESLGMAAAEVAQHHLDFSGMARSPIVAARNEFLTEDTIMGLFRVRISEIYRTTYTRSLVCISSLKTDADRY